VIHRSNNPFESMKSLPFLLSLLLLFIATDNFAQKRNSASNKVKPVAMTASERIDGAAVLKELKENSLTLQIPLRNIGPTVMSGRVVDIDVDPKDATHFFVAYASGGLWVTYNNGQSFIPIFNQEEVMTIGDIAVDWNHNETIWIGTGEVNSSRSSYSGLGMYIGIKSTANGRDEWTWKRSGLEESHHIGRVVLHPNDNLVAWVAVLGHLYSEDENRGVYKTVDGGKTWKKVLFVSNNTGAVDLVIDPLNPDEIYAATWQRMRSAWNFVGNGIGSGIYKSTDGGEQWSLISHPGQSTVADVKSHFNGTKAASIGRIGLALHHSEKGKFLYAMIDNQDHRPETDVETSSQKELRKTDFISMTKEQFLTLSDSLLEVFLRRNGFEEKLTAASAKRKVKENEIKPAAFYDYLYDANEDLFNTPIVGAEVYVYQEQNKQWKRTHEGYLDDLVFTYGYYFGVIHVSSVDPNKIYIGGVPLLRSNDGGKTFVGINPDNVHVDHHVVWENPSKPGHIINGSDGGVQISYDDGLHFVNCNSIPVGQFYAVQVDNRENYHVYGGLQDNGVWTAPHNAEINESWKITGQNPYREINSGDGMQIMVDDRDPNIVYTGYQFGNYMRSNLLTGETHYLDIRHQLGERPLRWNWQTPILLSSFNQDILYICSNKVHRSTDRGLSFETLSADLTKGAKDGNVPFGTITTISESPLRFGLLAVGTDDEWVHISRDNGYSWENVSTGLPSDYWVSRVVHSAHKLGRIYVSLNGYRNDYFEAMIFLSEDWGKTWKKISTGLPHEPVNVIREDPAHEAILYAGTDHGLYLSINRGISWMQFSADLPRVAVHDLAVQNRERDLLIGTHGRSLFLADIDHIGKLPSIIDSCVFAFEIPQLKRNADWGGNWSKWLEPDIPEIDFVFYSREQRASAEITVKYGDELELARWVQQDIKRGLNIAKYIPAIDAETASKLENAINSGLSSGDVPIKIKKADDGKYYLPKGDYVLNIDLPECPATGSVLTIR
jgi:photosystem II stability/assembly factor-like uncharacterized protein